jgi:hypothetical protein
MESSGVRWSQVESDGVKWSQMESSGVTVESVEPSGAMESRSQLFPPWFRAILQAGYRPQVITTEYNANYPVTDALTLIDPTMVGWRSIAFKQLSV